MTIWFSASCSLTILPSSVGLPAWPLRITSVDGSNRLTILPGAWVSPAKMRALVCRITGCTSGTWCSSSRRSPSRTICPSMSAACLTPLPTSAAKRLACPTTRLVVCSKLPPVGARQLWTAVTALGTCRAGDLQGPQFDAAAAIAQFHADITDNLGDRLHRAGQYPHPVVQQAAIGGIVDVGLDHGGVDAPASAFGDALVIGDLHDPLMDLFDHIRPTATPHRPMVLASGIFSPPTYPGEIAVDEIGAHLAFQMR